MGGKDLRRGACWLCLVAGVLAVAAASAVAAPPTGDFTVTPNPPNRGEPVVFNCEPCSRRTSVTWDFDANPDFERAGRTVTTTFATAGPRTVRMGLSRDGEVTVVSKTVTVNAPPTAAFDFDPASPLAGQEVAFVSQGSDPEGDPVSYGWALGDGATATGPAPRHSYTNPGTYTVRLTGTDSNGASDTTTRQIVVRADAGPSSSFTFTPAVPAVAETVTFTSSARPSQGSIVALDWDLDGDGDFDDGSGQVVTWAFDSPGGHVVRLRAQQSNGKSSVGEASVRVNGLPVADFTWNPASPVEGDSVDLVSTSTDFEGPLATVSWDLDGDGNFGDGSEPHMRQPFPRAGTYDIGLQVTDSDGRVSTVRKQVVVGAAQPMTGGVTVPGGGTSQPPAARRLRLMSPFPVIRIAGTVVPRGARISILSVRGPRGSQVRVRCLGKGCPVGSVARTSARRIVRFPEFERTLRAGIRLILFVRQGNRIGKYTRFLIRAGAPPKRVDLCLFPTRRAPGRCP